MKTSTCRPHTRRASRAKQRPAARPQCSRCHEPKRTLHRNRRTRRLVCGACADRARLRVGACALCSVRKLLQARGQCFACYKRLWRARQADRFRPVAGLRRAG